MSNEVAGTNFIRSAVRTIVPSIVASVAAWLASRWDFILDESMRTGAVLAISSLVMGVYYVLVRLVETYITPRVSWLLGDFRRGMTVPVYPDAPPPPNPAQPAPGVIDGQGGGAG